MRVYYKVEIMIREREKTDTTSKKLICWKYNAKKRPDIGYKKNRFSNSAATVDGL